MFAETMDEFSIDFHSIVSEMPMKADLGGKRRGINLRVVDPAYGDMRRIVPVQGRWLSPSDAQNLSPAIVVNAKFLKARGLGPGSLPATVTLNADEDVTATIVGQAPKGTGYSGGAEAFMLVDSYQRWFGTSQPIFDASYQMWVPPKGSKALAKAVSASIKTKLPGYQVEMGRQDYASQEGDPYKEFRYVLAGVSGIILLLGALSLLNIALVTIKQRVREIGIRRSFGATTGRVFFSVMMESVVATVVAGAVGVVAAVGISKSSFVTEKVIGDVTDAPGFPVSAALLGLVVSLAVGALAGVLPALIAVRVKIIDAIRF
ncbi:ABC transporter permease [Aeromicrobium sp. UC242_57]|uniref:ABC transporter permease n=1 Tax=Aeromicrobium sp. UC242_57 TaxID=3374624 RepID=UPI0037A26435